MTDNGDQNVSDDLGALTVILEDWQNGGTKEEVTGDLIDFYDNLTTSLTERNLKDNIQQSIRGITGVNGCDLSPIQRTLARIGLDQTLQPISNILQTALQYIERNPSSKILPYELSLNDLNTSAFRMCEVYGQLHNAVSIRDIEMSDTHYPDYVFFVEGKRYSYNFLYYYINYVFCSRFIDFSATNNIIEIGPGAGRQVEIIKKIHPHLNFYLIDLGPSLYLCHQYMKALFPDHVLHYETTRDLDIIRLENSGQIAFIGNWNIDRIQPTGKSLFVSQSTLSLMKPTIASRYLNILSSHCDHLFMVEPGGDESKTTYSMDGSACLTDFREILTNEFQLVNHEPAFYPLSVRDGFGEFELMMWTRE